MTAPSTCPTIIRTRTEFIACVPTDVAKLFWPRAQNDKGSQWVIQQQNGLLNGYASIPWAYILQLVPVTATQQGTTQMVGGQLVQVGGVYEETRPRSLAHANMTYANELFSDMHIDLVRQVAQQTRVRQDIPEVQMRAGCAIMTAAAATKANELLPNAIERERAKAGASGSSFWEKFSNGWKKLTSNPGEWAQRVFVTEPGKAVKWAGDQLMSLKKTGWVMWIVDPLGLTKQLGAFLSELGHAMIEGSISEFEEQRFMLENAAHWRQVGVALATAAPFLPPPFNIIALGLGALFTAAGFAIQALYDQAAKERENEERVQQLQQSAKKKQQLAADAAKAAQYAASLRLAADSADTITSDVLAPETQGLDSRSVLVLGLPLVLWGLYAITRR